MQKRFLYHDQLEAAAQQAEDQWRAGSWHDALGLYCQIFQDRWQDLQYEDRLTAADLTILERITDFAVPLGMAQECNTILVHVVTGYQRLGQGYWADRIQVKRIHLALNANQIDQACEQLGGLFGSPDFSIDSISRWTAGYHEKTSLQDRSELFAQVWLETGRLMHLQGQNQGAIKCFKHGLGYSTASVACTMRLQLAVIACRLELGELDEVRRLLPALKSNLDTVLSPGAATAWYELSAKADLLCGEFGSALKHLGEVWQICRSYSFVLPMLRAAMNLAQGLILLNQTIEARAILQQVHTLAVARSQNLLAGQAQRLLDVAGVQLHGGFERAASVIDEQAATKRVETSDPVLFHARHEECYTLAHFEDRALAFYWYLGLRRWVNARRSLDRLAPFRHTDSKIIHARLDAMRAMLEYYDGDPRVANQLLHKTRDVFLKMKLMPERWQIQVLWNRCRERLGASAAELASLAQENEALLESFGNSLPLQSRVTYFLDKATQLDEALASKVRQLQELRRKMARAGFFARFRLRLALWKGLNDLLDEAYWQKEAHNSGLLDNATTPDAVRKRTSLWRRVLFNSPREATLAFLVFPDSTVGICRRWLSLDFWVSRMGKQHLRLAVGEWHRLIPKADPEKQDALLRNTAQRLRLNRVLKRLPWQVRRLRILPDDILHGLPFGAIELPSSTGRPLYLGDRFSIS
ncbi:MAG TPA: hypothetical protein VG649_06220, partial [Candidatus Angelobacter sp.]|nr:hypothetical protein [Candidatus Angelobacter sp.]